MLWGFSCYRHSCVNYPDTRVYLRVIDVRSFLCMAFVRHTQSIRVSRPDGYSIRPAFRPRCLVSVRVILLSRARCRPALECELCVCVCVSKCVEADAGKYWSPNNVRTKNLGHQPKELRPRSRRRQSQSTEGFTAQMALSSSHYFGPTGFLKEKLPTSAPTRNLADRHVGKETRSQSKDPHPNLWTGCARSWNPI